MKRFERPGDPCILCGSATILTIHIVETVEGKQFENLVRRRCTNAECPAAELDIE